MNKQQVAGMVALYNSPTTTLSNIATYLSQVETLYVIDNSDVLNSELINSLRSNSKVHYHSSGSNKGIGYALNKAAQLARRQGYSYLLTMDDDSRAPEGLVDMMLIFLQTYTDGKVGIVSAAHGTAGLLSDHKVVLYTMTSGNLLDLSVHEQVGGFWEELFIDHVDHEYGLRLNSAGYKVIELPSVPLEHSLGQQKPVFLWYQRWHFISHQPIRMYYIVRNGWLVAWRHQREHPDFRWVVTKLILKEWVKSLFLENARWQRVRFLLKGTSDAWKGRMGKLK